MTRVLRTFAFIALSVFAQNVLAKDASTAPGSYNIDLSRYDFIDTTQNVIQFPKGNASFNAFFNKMDTLVFENRG